MIGALSGTIGAVERGTDAQVTVLVDVGGVGYEVLVSARHADDLGPAGSAVEMAVHTHVREGAITLYGLPDRAERRVFDLLVAAHGVGPALALAILSVHPPSALAAAVRDGDVEALVEVPGIGKKTAQRLLVELAGRLDEEASTAPPLAGRVPSEVREALAALGYAPDEVRAAVERLPEEGTTEELLRGALAELAPRS